MFSGSFLAWCRVRAATACGGGAAAACRSCCDALPPAARRLRGLPSLPPGGERMFSGSFLAWCRVRAAVPCGGGGGRRLPLVARGPCIVSWLPWGQVAPRRGGGLILRVGSAGPLRPDASRGRPAWAGGLSVRGGAGPLTRQVRSLRGFWRKRAILGRESAVMSHFPCQEQSGPPAEERWSRAPMAIASVLCREKAVWPPFPCKETIGKPPFSLAAARLTGRRQPQRRTWRVKGAASARMLEVGGLAGRPLDASGREGPAEPTLK